MREKICDFSHPVIPEKSIYYVPKDCRESTVQLIEVDINSLAAGLKTVCMQTVYVQSEDVE